MRTLNSIHTSLVVILKTGAKRFRFKYTVLRFNCSDLVVFLYTIEQKPDVILLTETCLNRPHDYGLPGYQILV